MHINQRVFACGVILCVAVLLATACHRYATAPVGLRADPPPPVTVKAPAYGYRSLERPEYNGRRRAPIATEEDATTVDETQVAEEAEALAAEGFR
jgi:hypothetical protein